MEIHNEFAEGVSAQIAGGGAEVLIGFREQAAVP